MILRTSCQSHDQGAGNPPETNAAVALSDPLFSMQLDSMPTVEICQERDIHVEIHHMGGYVDGARTGQAPRPSKTTSSDHSGKTNESCHSVNIGLSTDRPLSQSLPNA